MISTVIKIIYITTASATFTGLSGFFGKETLNILPGIIISSLGWPILLTTHALKIKQKIDLNIT